MSKVTYVGSVSRPWRILTIAATGITTSAPATISAVLLTPSLTITAGPCSRSVKIPVASLTGWVTSWHWFNTLSDFFGGTVLDEEDAHHCWAKLVQLMGHHQHPMKPHCACSYWPNAPAKLPSCQFCLEKLFHTGRADRSLECAKKRSVLHMTWHWQPELQSQFLLI